MNIRFIPVWTVCIFAIALAAAEPAAPVIKVAQPVTRTVTDYRNFTGRTDAALRVDLRARVTGYLTKVFFKDGSEVKRGDLLFQIDPRPYVAELDKAQANLALSEARYALAKAELDRAKALFDKGALDQQAFEKTRTDVEVAQAGVRAARASQESARLTLEFTRITAPIDGVIGARLLDPGSLVKADETSLAVIVSGDPIYVGFEIDENTLVTLRKAIDQGQLKAPQDAQMAVLMGLPGEDGFPHQGKINFINNVVNPATGTMTMRATFPNPKSAKGERLMSPGMFARVRFAMRDPYNALLVPGAAVMMDKGQAFVFVVDKKDIVQRRQVELGPRQEDATVVVKEGLRPEDWVAVSGLNELKPDTAVKPNKLQSSPEPGIIPRPSKQR